MGIYEELEQMSIGIADWLKKVAPYVFEEQKQLDADTVERIYWHYGYLVALRDVLTRLAKAN